MLLHSFWYYKFYSTTKFNCKPESPAYRSPSTNWRRKSLINDKIFIIFPQLFIYLSLVVSQRIGSPHPWKEQKHRKPFPFPYSPLIIFSRQKTIMYLKIEVDFYGGLRTIKKYSCTEEKWENYSGSEDEIHLIESKRKW